MSICLFKILFKAVLRRKPWILRVRNFARPVKSWTDLRARINYSTHVSRGCVLLYRDSLEIHFRGREFHFSFLFFLCTFILRNVCLHQTVAIKYVPIMQARSPFPFGVSSPRILAEFFQRWNLTNGNVNGYRRRGINFYYRRVQLSNNFVWLEYLLQLDDDRVDCGSRECARSGGPRYRWAFCRIWFAGSRGTLATDTLHASRLRQERHLRCDSLLYQIVLCSFRYLLLLRVKIRRSSKKLVNSWLSFGQLRICELELHVRVDYYRTTTLNASTRFS